MPLINFFFVLYYFYFEFIDLIKWWRAVFAVKRETDARASITQVVLVIAVLVLFLHVIM